MVPFVPFALLVAFFVFPLVLRRRRAQAIERLAKEYNLTLLERELPTDFHQILTGFGFWDTVRNAVAGFEANDMLVAFDIEVPRGRGYYLRTVVARRCDRPVHALDSVPKGFALRTHENWRALTLSGGWGPSTISPERITELWKVLS